MASTVEVSLPDPLSAYVEAQANSGDFGTPADYIRELIRGDRDRKLKAVETRLLDSLQGKSVTLSAEEVERGGVISTLRERLQQRPRS